MFGFFPGDRGQALQAFFFILTLLSLTPLGYVPPVIENRTIQHTNPMLTWDLPTETRLRVTTKKFTKEDLKEMDFSAYLASSDVEDDERDLASDLRGLLGELPREEEQEELRITFTPGLSQKIQAGMREKEFEKELAAATVFERRKMEKQRKKRLEREQARKEAEENEGSEEFDRNDPFGDGRGGADSDGDGSEEARGKGGKKSATGKAKKYRKKKLSKAEAGKLTT